MEDEGVDDETWSLLCCTRAATIDVLAVAEVMWLAPLFTQSQLIKPLQNAADLPTLAIGHACSLCHIFVVKPREPRGPAGLGSTTVFHKVHDKNLVWLCSLT